MSQDSNERNFLWIPLFSFLGGLGVIFLLLIVNTVLSYSDHWQKLKFGLFAFGVWGLFFYFLIPRIAGAQNPNRAVKIGGAVALSSAVVLGTFGISAGLPNKVPDLGDAYLQALTSLCDGRGSGGIGISEASPYTENQGIHPIVFIADGEMRSSRLPADWLPDGRENLELVLCIFDDPMDKGSCRYSFGPILDKLQHRKQFYLLAVNTGDLVAADTILGGKPECPGSVSSSRNDPVYGSEINFDEYLEFVRDFVER